jgi:hypothetical protein
MIMMIIVMMEMEGDGVDLQRDDNYLVITTQ